jgi:hypothetical protein
MPATRGLADVVCALALAALAPLCPDGGDGISGVPAAGPP